MELCLYIPAQFSAAQLGESKVMKDNLKVKVSHFLSHLNLFFLLFSFFMTRKNIPKWHVCLIIKWLIIKWEPTNATVKW